MPVPQHVVRMLLACLGTGALVLGISACGSGGDDGPTSAEAGTQLRDDAKRLLDQVQDIHNIAQPYTVSENATKDVSCKKDRSKRVFAAKTRVPVGANVDNTLDGETLFAMGALEGYEVAERPGADDLSGRRLVMHKPEGDLRLTLVLTPRGKEVDYALTGETGCLPATR